MRVHPPSPLDETSYEAGIKVQLHSQSEPPFLHELGFGVAPGFQTFVSTQEQRVAYVRLGLLHATNCPVKNVNTHSVSHVNLLLPRPFCVAAVCVLVVVFFIQLIGNKQLMCFLPLINLSKSLSSAKLLFWFYLFISV